MERIHQEFPGGVDVAINVVGTPQSLKQCFASMRRGGRLSIFGTYFVDTEVNLNVYDWQERVPTIYMGHEATDTDVLSAMKISERLLESGRVDLSSFITHVLNFEDVPKAVEMLRCSPALLPEREMPEGPKSEPEAIKVIIKVGPDAEMDGKAIGSRFSVMDLSSFTFHR